VDKLRQNAAVIERKGATTQAIVRIAAESLASGEARSLGSTAQREGVLFALPRPERHRDGARLEPVRSSTVREMSWIFSLFLFLLSA
jgi:hypothetical protein